MTFMFVYGTLKRGYGNNARCLAKSKFVGEAVSVGNDYVMASIGPPILWEDPKDNYFTRAKARGEIFEVGGDDLARCDRLEGHPYAYKREEREFTVNGETVKAWVYLWQRPGASRRDICKIVGGGYQWDA